MSVAIKRNAIQSRRLTPNVALIFLSGQDNALDLIMRIYKRNDKQRVGVQSNRKDTRQGRGNQGL